MVASINEHTNDRIRVGTNSSDTYGNAYDSIFRQNTAELADTKNLLITLESSLLDDLISKTTKNNVSIDSFLGDIIKKNLKFL